MRGTSARRFRYDAYTIEQRQARGEVVSGYDQVDGQVNVAIGADEKRIVVTYPDQITGTTMATNVYDNDRLVAINSTDRETAAYYDTGAPVYGDLRLANITGSNVTIATGDKSASVYATKNMAIVTADSGSTLYNVAGGSNIVYNSVTSTMSGVDQDGLRQPATQNYNVKVTSFSGVTFNGNDSVTDLDSLKRYNTFLINQLKGGQITPTQYDSLFTSAAKTSTVVVTVRNDPLNRYRAPPTTSERRFIKVDNSTLTTTADSRLTGMRQEDKNNDAGNTLIEARNGSTVTNNGVVTQAGVGAGILLDGAGTTLTNTNTGVIGIGYEVLDRTGATPRPTGVDDRAYTTNNAAVIATNGAVVINAGIINVANRDIASLTYDPTVGKANVGVVVGSGASVSNTGTILIGGGASAAANMLGSYDGAAGLVAIDGGTATNAAGGAIRVGVSFAETAADLATVTNVVSINPASGMTSLSGGGTLVNNGDIRIGGLAQNATGMKIGGDGGTAVNAGTITIDATGFNTPTKRNAAISVLGSGVAGAVNAINAAAGVINVNGTNAVGLLVENNVAGGSARAVNNGAIAVDGGVSVDGLRSYGIFVGNASSSAVQNGAITLRGEGAIGAHTRNGGTIELGSAGTVDFQGARQIGYYALGAGSTISGAGTTTTVDTDGSTGLRVEGGATATLAGQTFIVSGANAFGIVGSGASTNTTVDASGARITVSGPGATGVLIEGGATGVLAASSQIDLAGNNTVAAIVDGQGHDIDGVASGAPVAGTSLATSAALTSGFSNVTGYIVRNEAQLNSVGAIALTGAGSAGIVATTGGDVVNSGTINGSGTGVRIANGAAFTNNGAIALANGTGILVDGATSSLTGTGTAPVSVDDGVAALRLVNGANVTSSGSFTGGGTAHAVLVDTGAGGVTLGNGTILSTGSGNGIENAANSAAIRLDGTNVTASGTGAAIHTAVALAPGSTATVTAAGTNSIGFDFSGAGGAAIASDLALDTGLAITGTGIGATGVRLNTSGVVTLAGTVTINNAQGGSAVYAGPTSSLTNSGTLTSTSTTAPVLDLGGGALAFTNSGTITAASSTATAMRGGDNGQTVTFTAGPVTGAVALGAGNDTFLMTGGTLTGAFSAGGGNDDVTFRGLTNTNLAGVTAIAGEGAAGGSDTLTFDATSTVGTRRITGFNAVNLVNNSALTADGDLILAGGTATINAGSTYFAGNGVASAIGAATGGTATVVNAGLIDLTNGSSGATDTLTIRGNYVGQNGTLRLNTVLGADGSPSDRLIIDGGAVSGTTSIQIVNAGGLGAATPGDGIEVVSAINGGTTTALTTGTGFTLAGEHVDAGAFEYRLFASNRAGTNQSWYLRTGGNGQTEQPGEPEQPVDTTYRVEVPLLAALPGRLRRGDLAMLGTFHRRMGDEAGTQAGDGTSAFGRMWGRAIYEDGRYRQGGDARPTTDGRLYGFQLGTDLVHSRNAAGQHHFGIYGGYTDGRYDTTGFASGIENNYVGRLNPNTTYAGIYWTYLGDNGVYLDSVVQRSWYDGNVRASNGNRVSIDGVGIVGSMEAGIAIPVTTSWVLEPQVQLIGQGTSIDDMAIPNALVRQHDRGQLTGRVGLRARGRYETGAGAIQPYLRANLWRSFSSTGETLFATPVAVTTVRTPNSATWGEAGAGLTWSLGSRVSLYGEGTYRHSLDNNQGLAGHSAGGSIGLKISM